MKDSRGKLWQALARGPVEIGLVRARARFGELGVDRADLLAAAVSRIIARFKRAAHEPDEAGFRAVIERAGIDELALAIAWERGERSAWEVYARDFRPAVIAALRARDVPPVSAEEIADELPGALLAAHAEGDASPLAGYDGSGSLRAWLCTVARRRCTHAARRDARSEEFEDEMHETNQPGPAATAERGELGERLRGLAALSREGLTPRELLVLLLKHEQGLPQRAIAKRLGVSDSRVTRLLQHAIEKVRTRMGPELVNEYLDDGTLSSELIRALGSPTSEDPSDTDKKERVQ